MRLKIILIFVAIELGLIGYIANNILANKGKVLSAVSVNPILKQEYIFEKVDGLRNFYEPRPNRIYTKDLSWMGDAYTYSVKYSINSDALNQGYEIPVKMPYDVYRIVTIGDSFTFGENVNTNENYPSQLQVILNKECHGRFKYQIVNLGVGGYDIEYSVERYKLRGIKYKPNLVLWLLLKDDFNRFDEIQTAEAALYQEKLRNSWGYNEYVKAGNYYPGWDLAEKKILELVGGEKEALHLQKEYLFRLHNYFNGKIVFATFPFENGGYINLLNNYIHSYKTSYIFKSVYNITSSTAYHLPDGHPSAKGNKLIAQSIADYLIGNKVIPCK